MKKLFKSCLAKQFDEFVYSKEASGRWCGTFDDNLHFFDNFCSHNFPNANILVPRMLDWCKERPTENGNSCRSRIEVVVCFMKYARRKGWTEIEPPEIPTIKRNTYVPHAFTHAELKLFFKACDKHFIHSQLHGTSINTRLNLLELPTYFRLLLSTGMRTCEARWLKSADIDFPNGVININKSKGVDQHRIVLHDSMLALLQVYDKHIGKLLPNRNYFFPNAKDGFHRPAWAEYHFRIIWKEVSHASARPYDFRSYYAVTNISGWDSPGFELHEKLFHLSRTMGHRKIESTYGYFNLTPALGDKLKKLTEESFNELLPKLSENE